MSVFKDKKTGTYYCEFRYKDYTGKSKNTKKRGFKKSSEAKEWERNFLLSISSEANNILFSTFSEMYLKDCKNRVKITTFNNKEKIHKLYLIPFFENITMVNITPLMIRNWQNKILEKGYTKSYYKTLQKELSAIFNYAVKYYNLKYNPLNKAGLLSNSPLLKEKKKIIVWSLQEFNLFINEVKESRNKELELIFTTLYYTGLRIGELLALNINDIDFNNSKISITKTLTKVNGKTLITPPKTKSSNRTIKIPNFLNKMIKEYSETLYDPSADLLFTTSRTNLHEHKKRYSEKVGLNNIRLHDFRHSHVSLLIEKGVDIVTISKRIGHESVKMTLDVYSHMMQDSENRLIEVLENL